MFINIILLLLTTIPTTTTTTTILFDANFDDFLFMTITLHALL